MKYRFSFFLDNIDKWAIGELNKRFPNSYYVEKLLNGYTFNYDIPKRKIVYYGREKSKYRAKSFFPIGTGKKVKMQKEVDWRETIYNMKVSRVRKCNYKNFKISFSVECTPKEAFIIGKELQHKYYSASYKAL